MTIIKGIFKTVECQAVCRFRKRNERNIASARFFNCITAGPEHLNVILPVDQLDIGMLM